MNIKLILCVFLAFCSTAFSAEKISIQKNAVDQEPIYNIFFHPLIVYPKLAFTCNNDHLSYIDDWFVTSVEFKKIIRELYKRGFVLVSPKDVFEEKKTADGQLIISRKNLILPIGKKPLILSLDDYNFYNTMKKFGTIHRFWVNKKNKLVTITNKNNTTTIIRDNQEIPQILEKFIGKHPDFSYNKARGIISLTGYNGVFGYNTHELLSNNDKSQLVEAKKTAIKLKKMGWEFASHSYFHVGEEKQTEQVFEESEQRWVKEVGTIVGPTSYYIFPFGDAWNKNKARMDFLKSMGYKYFFGVSKTSTTVIEPGDVVMGRFPMDGRTLRGQFKDKNVFVNPADILDSSRQVNCAI